MNIGRRASFWVPLALWGCSKPHGARGVAEAFIDRYYIERDHKAALALATGMAAARVESEEKLVEDAHAAGVGSSAVSPHVYYKFKSIEQGKDGATLDYLLTIDSGGVSLKKELRLTVAPVAGEDKVSFFNETDLPQ
jgi:hypothetical protein